MAAHSSLPSWTELAQRFGLVARSHVAPITQALHSRRHAFAARVADQRRAAVTRQAKMARQRAVYAGAMMNRLNADWVMGPLSADLSIRGDLRALRDRARQLVRDNPLAKRYMRLAIENIIGADGIAVEPQVLLPDGKTLDEKTNAYLKERWQAWCHVATVDGRTFNDVERLAAALWKTEGEHLMAMLPSRKNEFGFALQVLDADQLDHEYNGHNPQNGNEIRLGVEVDSFMNPVGFWLWTGHPSEPGRGRRRDRVAAEMIIHLAEVERAYQTRGVTPFAPVMQDLNMLAGMQEAMLVLQRTAACKMGFIEVDPEKTSALETEDGADQEGAGVTWDAEPGKIEQLPSGMTFTNWDPGQPGSEYDPFTRNVERKISAGLNVSYSSLTGDLSQANYGSQRGGLLSERDGWMRDQQTVIGRMHRPVYLAWLRHGILSGAIDLPYDLARFGRVHFQPRGFPWIDPAKDIEASLAEVNAGLDSLTDIAARKGRDYSRILATRKREIELAREMGVPINLTMKGAAQAPANNADSGDDNENRPRLAAV